MGVRLKSGSKIHGSASGRHKWNEELRARRGPPEVDARSVSVKVRRK